MLYIIRLDGKIVHVTESYKEAINLSYSKSVTIEDRHDWKNFEEVSKIAVELSVLKNTEHLAVDQGDWISPRFNVIKAPKIGDKVSQCFNGDSYPEGEIVKVTPSWQVTTSTGKKFRRVKKSSTWLRAGGTFAMIIGHYDERNPSF